MAGLLVHLYKVARVGWVEVDHQHSGVVLVAASARSKRAIQKLPGCDGRFGLVQVTELSVEGQHRPCGIAGLEQTIGVDHEAVLRGQRERVAVQVRRSPQGSRVPLRRQAGDAALGVAAQGRRMPAVDDLCPPAVIDVHDDRSRRLPLGAEQRDRVVDRASDLDQRQARPLARLAKAGQHDGRQRNSAQASAVHVPDQDASAVGPSAGRPRHRRRPLTCCPTTGSASRRRSARSAAAPAAGSLPARPGPRAEQHADAARAVRAGGSCRQRTRPDRRERAVAR